MLRSVVLCSALLSGLCALADDLKDCSGQTTGEEKVGNLTVMSYHIHYNTNTTGMKLFYEAFIEEFKNKLPWQPGGPRVICPFGPNFGSKEWPYVCDLDGAPDWGADAVFFGPKGESHGPGPWDGPQRAFFIPAEHIEMAWAWARANRFHTDVLRHPNTGCMHDDHSVRALWEAENPDHVPHIDILEFPCNMPETGCNDSFWEGPPTCGCNLPLPDDDPANSCVGCLAHGGYIEDLTLACTTPPLQVEYQVKYYSGEVTCGNLFLESDIGGGIDIAPVVKYPQAQEGSYYTLIMVDPDADLPCNGSWPDVTVPGSHAPVRHWVVGNLDRQSLVTGNFSTGFSLTDFKGPSPPWGSHRYGQFLYKQPKKLEYTKISNPSRTNWDYKRFLGYYALADKLVASNWHVTQHAAHRAPTLPEPRTETAIV
mmetsp:Transcript_4673/g.13062  ORF Transcript_4673/g.13062 Transcript_4673/m.13062 type:complete len:425 (-) Transcript_4673:243-1517(-)